VLVKFRPGISQAEKDTVAASHGGRLKKRLKGESELEQFELTAGDALSASLQLNLESLVEFAEPNFIVKSDQFGPANDLRFSEQWALSNTGQNSGQHGSDINVVPAWQVSTGAASTVIAVIDSGVDFTHPDLVNNMWTNAHPTDGDAHGWDFITNSGVIKDEQGHGTAVAGIIAAQGNNDVGVSGVMWRAGVMSLRVLDNTGNGDVSDAVEAIDYAVAHGAQVINLSWGTEGYSIALKDAIDRALRRGVVIVCSAGNSGRNLDDGTSAYFPASFDSAGLIAVAGSDNHDQLESWSNFGATHVAIAAPGDNILTTQMGGGYWTVSGTSAAAPLVTGIGGLMKSVRPALNARQTKSAIIDAARRTASLNGKLASGGVVDAAKSIVALPGSGNGNGSGNGQGNGHTLRPPTPGFGSGGAGPGGSFDRTPPPQNQTLPGSGNYRPDEMRRHTPTEPTVKTPIQSNLLCGDCDTQSGGGGSTYHPSADPNFSTARLQPRNDTGDPGVNLGSRNFNWNTSIVSLPGRAGLDLNLSLFYNSLVWTKDGGYIKYNADLGSPAPGFQLGLPKLQQRFLDAQTGGYAYVMVTPSGGRVEMRQVSTNIYESQDGSYTQLDDGNPSVVVVRTKDGTQLIFTPIPLNNEYRCTQIKDRNGNYISASYDLNNGHLQTVTDTLGRVVTFVYDGNNNLQAVRQTWNGVPHDWATFIYGEVFVAPNFGGGLLVNGPNNNNVTVLTRVNLDDGSYVTFGYNAAFGQVNRITHYASNGAELSHTAYNMESSAGQTDSPRFTEQRDWATHWNNDQEAVTSYAVAADSSWSQQTMPDGTIYKELFATSGWHSGLTIGTEIWSGGVKKKWTTTAWTQDDTNLTYQKNPRPYDMSTYDEAGNRRHTDIIYTSYSLPGEVREYSADGSGFGGFSRRTYIGYNFGQAYLDRRIIGLVSDIHVVDENNNYVTKLTYDYDRGGEYLAATPQPATQHDATNYGAGFVMGRGNRTDVWRWDVTDIYSAAKAVREQHTGYNTTGSVVFTRDALNHQTSISYSDAFSSGLTNLALNRPASQISEGWGGAASRAVDGNTDGNWVNNSVTHTYLENQPWWQVDLGSMQSIQSIDIWNRTDCCSNRLTNFNVYLLDESFNVVTSTSVPGQAASPTTIQLSGTARYVKIQLVGTDYLSLAEVQVWGNRNTFAYPTKATDPDGFFSTASYNFDYGAMTRTTDPKGASVSMEYDAARRPTRVSNTVNGAYKRYVYADGQDYTLMFETLNDVADTAHEFYTFTWNDGAGRIHGAGGALPNSSGGYFVQKTVYDVMGRAIQETNPTEITGAIIPAGDDAASGWVWTYQEYDWKGRPTLTTLPGGNTRENTYGGCGCAGGEVTTVRDERGRRRRATMDVFGRLKQTDELNWDQTVYSTTTYSYNARDQITQTNQAGQVRTLEYDGYGRLWRRTTPEQGATAYSYSADGATQTVTDARGATTTFGYNNRHLPTSITYGVPAGVAATPNVSFGYDEAGNRTSMNDGLGSVSYVYNTLSQMTSETRTFSALAPQSYTFSYGYNLSGELTSITNPSSTVVGYGYDVAGRPTNVSGSGYYVTSYVNSIAYRAFGMKQMAYANGRTLSLSYDSRLRLSGWDVPGVMGWTYAYDTPLIHENTHRVAFANNLYDHTLDRSYDYDNVGRMWASHSGREARWHTGQEAYSGADGPYAENYAFDQLGNMTWRNGWGAANSQYTYNPAHVNNRMTVNPITGGGMQYDDAGNLTNDGSQSYSYDATGQQAYASGTNLSQIYDGDGMRAKKTENGDNIYYLRSSVLGGQVIAEIYGGGVSYAGSGWWLRGYVYLGSQMIATQAGGVNWVHQDPVTKSQRITDSAGNITYTIDLDPWGSETGRTSGNAAFQPHRFTSYERDANAGDDAMFRRYQSAWTRFSQPDPYEGSYDLTDPQSFNRYAYVQDDPVNLVDPTGLDPPVVGIVTVYGTFDYALMARATSGGRTGGGAQPRYYQVQPHQVDRPQRGGPGRAEKEVTDCMQFAAMVDGIASQTIGRGPAEDAVHNFMNKLATTFTEFFSAAAGDVYRFQRYGEGNRPSRTFGSSGFATPYYEPPPGNNQVRHAAGGLVVGYAYAFAPQTARNRMDEREDPNDPVHGIPDLNLNAQTLPMGERLASHEGRELALGLGNWIRNTLCAH
jgi:RHS repeat-associated protein